MTEEKKKIAKDSISGFFHAMSESLNVENRKIYKRVIEGIKIKDFSTPELFYYSILYPWDKFISGFLDCEISNNEDVKFLFEHSRFIENHFRSVFEVFEGSACCADKSRTMLNALVKFYSSGKEIVLNYDGEYTYHLPSTVLKDHESIISFFVGLKSLYYGKPLKYLQEFALFSEQHKTAIKEKE